MKVANFKLTAIMATVGTVIGDGIKSKMVTRPIQAVNEKPLSETVPPYMDTLQSKNAIFAGSCEPDSPFEFKLSAGSGHGAICSSNKNAKITAALQDTSASHGEIAIARTEGHCFSTLSERNDNSVGYQVEYDNVEASGGVVTVTCTLATGIVVVYADEISEPIQVRMRYGPGQKRMTRAIATIESNGQAATAPERFNVAPKSSTDGMSTNKISAGAWTNQSNKRRRRGLKGSASGSGSGLTSKDDFDVVENDNSHRVVVEYDEEGDVLLLNLEVTNTDGKVYQKTIETEFNDRAIAATTEFDVGTDINEEGDIELTLINFASERALRCSARIAIICDGEIVDKSSSGNLELTAMIDAINPMLVLHGGWIRKHLEEHNLSGQDNGWDIVVADAHCLDPEHQYQKSATLHTSRRLVEENESAIRGSARHRLLSASPTDEEREITDEMLMGRKPKSFSSETNNRIRRLSGGKLMLVHGYCSSDVWGPVQNQFENSIKFTDFEANRSHDDFARRIASFGESYGSFGIVAHSQGGAAALHLYTYYWSGLDSASSGRLIQSVGTPYQGTALAGDAATLGDIFGVGCGTNDDLTYSGASAWLSGIPSWARSKVHYYTTSFEDRWWSYDYCHLVTDVFLNDPDDGTTERWSGQLTGANNMGHKEGWCHTSGMRHNSQTMDGGRNSNMSNFAAR